MERGGAIDSRLQIGAARVSGRACQPNATRLIVPNTNPKLALPMTRSSSLACLQTFASLESVWIEPPLYFLTICVAGRRPILANDQAFDILRGEFGAARER